MVTPVENPWRVDSTTVLSDVTLENVARCVYSSRLISVEVFLFVFFAKMHKMFSFVILVEINKAQFGMVNKLTKSFEMRR